MAPSPRDHDADADIELSRKRARLSEEDDSPASGGPVEIEALAPETIGGDGVNTIALETDYPMDPFSETFQVLEGREPIDQLCAITETAKSAKFLAPEVLMSITKWLVEHIQSTADEPKEYLEARYMRDYHFFGEFSITAIELLNREVWFRREAFRLFPELSQLMENFLQYLMALSVRFINLLPAISREQIVRKDSATEGARSIHVPTLLYIHLAARLATLRHHNAPFLKDEFALKAAVVGKSCQKLVSADHGAAAEALLAVYRDITDHIEEITIAWLIVDSILELGRLPIYQGECASGVIEITKKVVLPIICNKRPRDLPDGFHERLLLNSGSIVHNVSLANNAFVHGWQMYEQTIQGAQDALFSSGKSGPQNLQELCNGDSEIVSAILRATWTLQAQRSFIQSTIMDVRSCGMTMMCQELTNWYKRCCIDTLEGVNHPVIDYAARFLRENALTDYIFSADSHASIIDHSEEIVTFLAVTFTYTDHETDKIWQACTTSVEADFVQASYRILGRICQHLSFHQLHHLVKKYATTPLSRVSNHTAVETLSTAFFYMRESTPVPTARQDRLAVVMVALEIVIHMHKEESTPASPYYLNIAMGEIAAAFEFATEDRIQIYDRCAPHITQSGPASTAAFQVLHRFLAKGLPPIEGERLLAMLPVQAVVDELCKHVNQLAERAISDPRCLVETLSCRLGVVAYMMCFAPTRDHELEDTIFEHLFGEHAANNQARDIAWGELASLSKTVNPRSAAVQLLERYSELQIPALTATCVTRSLMMLVKGRLAEYVQTQGFNTQYPKLLEHPLWHTLLRIAVESLDPSAAEVAFDSINLLLFGIPQKFTNRDSVVQCHVDFLRGFVDRLCNRFPAVSAFNDQSQIHEFRRAMSLLDFVCRRSRDLRSEFQCSSPPTAIVLNPSDAPACLSFSLQICAPERHQALINVRASEDTTFEELASAVRSRTGTSKQRIVIGGRVVDVAANPCRTLKDGGVQAAGGITVYPIYDSSCHLDNMLTDTGPVEQELVAQHDRLEDFLDGPPPVAEATQHLLATIRPSSSACFRVREADISAKELFPVNSHYRTKYSLHLLSFFLRTYARFGVVEPAYMMRGMRFLVDYITDENRCDEPKVSLQVLGCLMQFLQERPDTVANEQYFRTPAAFGRRMIELLMKTLHNPQALNSALRTELAVCLYKVTLEACRVEPEVWTNFVGDERTVCLHGDLLLDDDHALTTRLKTSIENFCADEASPSDRVEKFWLIISASLDKALARPYATAAYFGLAAHLLNSNAAFQANEQMTRDWVQVLLRAVHAYTHFETPELPIADPSMIGLLRLFGVAIDILKSFKKSLRLGQLSSELFSKLLFHSKQPLLHPESRNGAYNVVKATCETKEDYCGLSNAMQALLTSGPLPAAPQNFPGIEGWIRPPNREAGLMNLGMTCYMNSLLQQLFANFALRKFIFDTPVVDCEKQEFLQRVQELFAEMQDSSQCTINPGGLAQYLDIPVQSQEDVHTFYGTFLGRLEDSMPDDEHKETLAKFYGGTFVSQIRGSCGHVSVSKEPFSDISITVKNKANLFESLNEFVQGEPMQGSNKYRCQTCDTGDGRLVDAMKRTCLDEVPDHLTFCLKRFTFECMMGLEGKVNDCFEFPERIDMSRYGRAHLEQPENQVEQDLFDLVGVIVHQGDLGFGHYWSYCRVAGSMQWVRLEDQNVQQCQNFAQLQQECFGGLKFTSGQDKTHNAYVLFYERQRSQQHQVQPSAGLPNKSPVGLLMPPRAQPPACVATRNAEERLWRHQIANIFAPAFATFTEWLISTSPPLDQLEARCEAVLSAKYLLRVVFTDYSNAAKVKAALQAIKPLVESRDPIFAQELVQAMLEIPSFCQNLWTHGEGTYIQAASDLVTTCFQRLKNDAGEETYVRMLEQMLLTHALALRDLGLTYGRWKQYFALPMSLSRLGPDEHALVLDQQYILRTLDIVQLQWTNDETKRLNQHLWDKMRGGSIDLSPLFDFLHGILQYYVNLEDVQHKYETRPAPGSPEKHTVGDLGVLLWPHEWTRLTMSVPQDGADTWTLAYVGCTYCPPAAGYETFAPGLLVALLAGERSNYLLQTTIEQTMRLRFDKEEEHLVPMLQMTLHFLQARGVRTPVGFLKQLGKNLTAWVNMAEEVLRFCHTAFRIVPGAIIESATEWAYAYLTGRDRRLRVATLQWLQQYVFVDPQPNALQTSSRLRLARAMTRQCLPRLQEGYRREDGRFRYEERLAAMMMEKVWLEALHGEMINVVDDRTKWPGGVVNRELLTEYEESKSTMKSLQDTLKELEGWEEETLALPEFVLAEGRPSMDGGDAFSSDADADEDDDVLSEYTETSGA